MNCGLNSKKDIIMQMVKTFLLRKGESSLFTKFKFTEADVTFYQKIKICHFFA